MRRAKAPEKKFPLIWVVGVLLFAGGGYGAWRIGAEGVDPLDRLRSPRSEPASRSFVDDPIDLEVAPLVSELEWARATATPDAGRRYTGRLALPSGAPLAGAEYWILPAQKLPADEVRGDLAKGSLWKPLVPALGITDANGGFGGHLPEGSTPLVVVRLHASLAFASTFADGATVELTGLASLGIGVKGVPADSEVRFAVTPTFSRNRLLRRGYGSARDIVIPGSRAGSAWAMLRGEIVAKVPAGDAPWGIAWPGGRSADLGFDGLGFDLVPASKTLEAGDRVETKLARRFRMLEVALPEPARAGPGGFAVLSFRPDPSESRRRQELVLGKASFDLRAASDATYVLDVVDGEANHYHAEFLETELAENGRFELGAATATKPTRLRVPLRPGLAKAQLWCEKSDRIFAPLTNATEYSFVLDEFGCVTNPRPGEYLLAHAPRDWRQIFVVLEDGEVARVTADPRREIVAEWLPSVALPAQDLGVLASRYFGSRAGELFFQIDLPGLEGEGQEVRCDHVSVPRQLAKIPTWSKRVPVGYASRLVCLVPNEVFEKVELTEAKN